MNPKNYINKSSGGKVGGGGVGGQNVGNSPISNFVSNHRSSGTRHFSNVNVQKQLVNLKTTPID